MKPSNNLKSNMLVIILMLQSIEKLKNNHIMVDKTYPPYIVTYPPYIVEHKNVLIDYEAINPIDFNSIENDIINLNITDGTKSPPSIYKNIKTNQYYIQYINSGNKFRKCLFDITDDYDWGKVVQEKIFKKEFMRKNVRHIIPIFTNKFYYPGSPEYDKMYPPVK